MSEYQPVKITGKSANAVLVSEEDWDGINETLYLLSIPGMRESIRSGMQEPSEDSLHQLRRQEMRNRAPECTEGP